MSGTTLRLHSLEQKELQHQVALANSCFREGGRSAFGPESLRDASLPHSSVEGQAFRSSGPVVANLHDYKTAPEEEVSQGARAAEQPRPPLSCTPRHLIFGA